MAMAESQGTGWHLDKRVPLAIIFAILVQTGGAIWWAGVFSASMNERVEHLEENVQKTSGNGERLIAVETHQKDLSAGQRRIERRMERIEGKLDRALIARGINDRP